MWHGQNDLADAIGVVLADRYRTDRVFTLDQRDSRAITPPTAASPPVRSSIVRRT